MHRSGTSALTQVLGLAGAALPAHLMSPQPMNEKGFFESTAIFELHEEMLSEFGSSWDDLSPMQEGWEATGLANDFADRMADAVLAEFGRSPLFVLKDPRICRLVPFWQDVLSRLEVESRFVIPVRNPLEVSASLARAQGMDEQRARLLWLQHFLLAERDTRGLSRVFVTYAELVEDWRRVLGRVVDEFGIVLPRWSRRAEAEIDGFLSKQLRHHEIPDESVEVRADVAEWVRDAYGWAEKAARGKAPSSRTLDRLTEKFFAAESVFGPIVASTEHQRREEATELLRLREVVEGLEAESHPHEMAASPTSGLEQRMDEMSGSMKKLMLLWAADMHSKGGMGQAYFEQIVSDLQGDREPLVQEIELVQLAAQQGATATEEQVAAEISRLESALSVANADLERLRVVAAERDSMRDRVVQAEAELEQRRREIEASETRLAKVEQRALEQDATVEDQRNRLSDFGAATQRLETVEAEREELRGRVQTLDEELQSLLQRSHESGLENEARVAKLEREVELLRGVDERLQEETASVGRLAAETARLEAVVDGQARLLEGAESASAKLSEVEERLVHRESELTQALIKVEAFERDVPVLRNELGEREVERDGLRAEVAQANLSLSSLEQERLEAVSRIAELHASSEAGTARLSAVEVELASRNAELAESREAVSSSKVELVSLRGELSESAARVESLHASSEAGAARLSSLEVELARRDAELVETRESVSSSNVELASLRGELLAVAREAKAAEDLRSKLAEGELALTEARRTGVTLQEELSSVGKALESERQDHARIGQLEAALESKEIELQRHRAGLREVGRLRERLIKSERAFEGLREDAEHASEANAAALSEATTECEAREGRLSEQEVQLGSARVMYEDLRLHAARVESELEIERRSLEVVGSELENERRSLEVVAAELAESNQRLATIDLEDSEKREEEGRRFDARMPGPFRRQFDVESEVFVESSTLLGLPKRFGRVLYWALTLRLRQKMKERKIAERLRASGVFDADHYRTISPESAQALGDPVMHYVRHGASEGRNPNAAFDTRFYLETNEDVRSSRENPLDHFMSHGWQESRQPHPYFDSDYYLRSNPDVATTGENPLRHWLESGWREGRLSVRSELLDVFRASWRSGRQNERAAHGASGTAEAETENAGRVPSPGELAADKESVVASGEPVAPNAIFRFERVGIDRDRLAHHDDPIVIVVTHELPYPPRAGNQYRIHRYIRWLESRGYQILTFYSPLPGVDVSERDISLASAEVENLIVSERSGRLRASLPVHLEPIFRALDGKAVLPVAPQERFEGETDDRFRERVSLESAYCPDSLVQLLVHVDGELPPGRFLITNYVWLTRFLSLLRPETRSLIDTHDRFSSKAEKVAAQGIPGELDLTEEQERQLLLRGDVVMAIQYEEAAAFRRIVPERPVLTVGVDFDFAENAESDINESEAGPPTVGMIGSQNAMNIKGANEFLRHVWPLLRREVGEARLLVAGHVGSAIPTGLPGVEIMGPVDDVGEFYRQCHVVVNPTSAGTGLKVKTVEAIAHRRALVSWPLGVEGVPEPLLDFCYVATDWYEFFLRLEELLSSKRPDGAVAREASAVVEELLSPASVYAALGDEVDQHCRQTALDD